VKCVFCVEPYEKGYPLNVIPKTFTAQQWLQAGSGVCPRCYEFLKSPEIRRNSWVIRGPEMILANVEFLEDPLMTLLNPPKPPFRLYLTRQKRKHGWIRLIHNLALSQKRFPIAFEEDLIRVDLSQIQKMHVVASKLIDKGASKRDLIHGFTASKAAKLQLTREDFITVETFRGNPLWEVVVSFERKSK